MQFTCEASAMPGNVTVHWYRGETLVHEVQALDSRVTVRKDNSLVINPVSADDSGQYICEVSNGIGDPQSASAYLNVECEKLLASHPPLKFPNGFPFDLVSLTPCPFDFPPTQTPPK